MGSPPNNALDTTAPDLASLHHEVVNLAKLVKQMKEELDQFHEVFNNIKVFIKIVVAVERTAVVIAKIAAAGVILWTVIKYGINNAVSDLRDSIK